MKKYRWLSFLIFVTFLSLVGCKNEKDDNNEQILLLLLLNQRGKVVFSEVSPKFALRPNEKAYYNPGPWGESDEKLGVKDLERETAMDVTITLDSMQDYAYITANVGNNLTNNSALAFYRLEAGGIRGVIEEDTFNFNSFLPNGTTGTNIQGAAKFNLVPKQSKTFCLELHREIKDKTNEVEVEGHLIAWDKPCKNLSQLDKSNYTWDYESEMFKFNKPLSQADNNALTLIAKDAGVGYVVTPGVSIKIRPYKEKFAAAGSIR